MNFSRTNPNLQRELTKEKDRIEEELLYIRKLISIYKSRRINADFERVKKHQVEIPPKPKFSKGNVLIFKGGDGRTKLFTIDREYVVKGRMNSPKSNLYGNYGVLNDKGRISYLTEATLINNFKWK